MIVLHSDSPESGGILRIEYGLEELLHLFVGADVLQITEVKDQVSRVGRSSAQQDASGIPLIRIG